MLISIIGDVGSGKTLLSTMIAEYDTRPVLANYKIKIGKRFKELQPEMLNSINKPTLVIIDEAYAWLESRRSGSPISIYMSYILFQSRKLGIDIITTEQLVGTIDTRFRQMTNWIVECQLIPDVGFQYDFLKMSKYNYFAPKRFILPFDIAEKHWNKYDTYERINPIDDEMMLKVATNKKDIVKEVDRIVAQLFKEYEPMDITKGIVSDFCLRNSKPKSYVQLVYDSVVSSRVKLNQ